MAAVLDPSVLVSPDYQVQMQQAERQRALAQALQQQAMQDTPGNGGSVSWTQGAARLAEALASTIANKRAMKTQLGASQAYAKGMASMFGLPQTAPAPSPQAPQGAPPAPQSAPTPPMPPQAPQQAPAGPPADPLAVLPDAPPQAAPPPPAAASMPPQGGAPPSSMGPMNLTGDPRQDMGLYVMNPEKYGEAMISAHTPTDFAKLMQQSGIDPNSALGHQIMQQQLFKQNYVAPTAARPGGWTQDPQSGQWTFHPQAPIPGAVPGKPDAQGNMTWNVPAGVEDAVRERALSQSGGEAAGKAPFQFQQVFNQQTGQMEYHPVSEMAGHGGGSLNQYYGGSQGAPGGPAGGAHYAAGPSLGQTAAADAYGKGNAQAFLDTQGIAKESPQRVQALREMQSLISGPGAMSTGPTAARMQQLAEQHGLPFGYSSNAFVFNKDAARFVAQSASDLGLNGSDARLGMMAHASPNMTMTPEALKVVMPTMIGLEYAKMAKATAAASWAQRDPGGNAKFETTWRQSYDPRMFTAYAQGGAQALAHAPANLRQQWLRDYRNLKGMGVDFTQFAQ